MREPLSVVRGYLRATYARDFAAAYRYVSSEDRRAKDLNQYLRQRGPFNGFALKVARLLAAMVEIEAVPTPIAENRIQVTARYQAPDPEKLSELLLGWNGYRLNSLSPAERQQIIEALEKKQRGGKVEMIRGEEQLLLINESDEWRVFLDWTAGVTISFRNILQERAVVDVNLSQSRVVTQPGEVFEITLKIKNRSQQPIVARIGHLVEPHGLADYIEFIQCGFLLPVKLQPGIEQEYSGTYLLRGTLPEGVRRLNLNYEFRFLHEK
ncbi:MAG: cytochrome c oxidase assembly protein [Deltaproteobacteria bacterium]|nr:cytochrome c oxidase assembly protein [Deltaproteobacteria bacterium]